MAMPKLFGQVLEKLEGLGTVIAMLQRMEAKQDKLIALLEADANKTLPGELSGQRDPMQVTMKAPETLSQKMQKTGDFAQAMEATTPVKPVKK